MQIPQNEGAFGKPSVLHLFIVYGLLAIAIYCLVTQCSRTEEATEKNATLTESTTAQHNRDVQVIDSLTTELLTWKGLAEACQNRANQALAKFESATAQLKNALYEVGITVDALSQKEQQVETLKRMVANGSVPKSRLADTINLTGKPILTDPVLVSGVAKTTYWLEVYKARFDSTAKVAATAIGQVDNYKQQRDNAVEQAQRDRSASLLAEEELVKIASPQGLIPKKSRRRQAAEAVPRVRAERVRAVRGVNEKSELEDELN